MDTFLRSSQYQRHSESDKADIEAVRLQLKLTVHDIALALANRAGTLDILSRIAGDLRLEASILQQMSGGRTPPRH